MFVYLNGEIVRKEEAKISLFDHGFLYGVGLFETFRIYNGHAFLLDDHLERLNNGLAELLIEGRITGTEAKSKLELILEANGYQNAYIRFNVSAGYGELGLTVEPYTQPNIAILSKPLPAANDELQEKKAEIVTVKRNTPEGTQRLKSHHFLNNLYARREIGSRMDTEGIFLTKDGLLAEGVVSNLFWVQNGTLFTPSVDTGILDGVTRRFIIKLAETLGMETIEGYFKPEMLTNADEIFVTNSIQELVGISHWNGITYPGKNGRITNLLHNQYCHYREKLKSRNELN